MLVRSIGASLSSFRITTYLPPIASTAESGTIGLSFTSTSAPSNAFENETFICSGWFSVVAIVSQPCAPSASVIDMNGSGAVVIFTGTCR